MQSTQAEDPASGNDTTSQQRRPSPQGGTGSGEGAASAFARMKSQHDHLARQRPADDASPGGHQDRKP
jgi:hypothetical protein